LRRRDEILRIAARHGAHDVRVFGSVVRGEAGKDSDVDFLVRLDDDRSLIDHIALMQDLEDFFGCKIDVVSEEALHRLVRDHVLAEAVPL
jgi:predicted nucleotidyltransferase